MRKLAAVFVLLIAPALCWAEPIKITGPAKAEPYKILEFSVTGDTIGAGLLWDVSPEETADVRELPDGKLLLVGPPGVYKIKCTVVRLKGGATIAERARFTTTIGVPPPPPPPPPPPIPDTPLAQAIQAAYTLEPGVEKARHRAALASLYREAARTANDLSLKTYADLFAVLKTASLSLLPADALPGVRRVIGNDLNAITGTNANAAIDRARTSAEFQLVATILDGVK